MDVDTLAGMKLKSILVGGLGYPSYLIEANS